MISQRLIRKNKERLDREVGTIYKSHSNRIKFALAFPNTYYVGMSNLGFQVVYRLLNEHENIVCERVFLPDPLDVEEFQRTSSPLFAMESCRPVKEFDVIAFSIPYELDYPNVLKILSLAGLEITSEARRNDIDIPLVIAGGAAVILNPEPMSAFIDAFIIGEAEEVMPEVVDTIARCRYDKKQLLFELANIKGVYVPAFYDVEYNDNGTIRKIYPREGVPPKVRRRWTPNLLSFPAISTILTPETEFSNMILVEIARGCGRKCRFCAAGYIFLPPRPASPKAVLEAIRKAEEKARGYIAGSHRVGLISASVFDHPSSLLICQSLLERDRLFSISSTRADTLDKDIVQALHQGGQETLTIAPEAGTDRLRSVINKGLTDEDIFRAASVAWDGGFRRLKLYFMVGLPTETDEDLEGIYSLLAKLVNSFPWERLTVSLSCFVPKPWTPFQWVAMDERRVLAEKLARVSTLLKKLPKVEVKTESAREAVMQAVLARGDRRIWHAVFDYSIGKVSWKAAFKKIGIDPAFYAHRSRHKDEVFPWDHIDIGIDKSYLWQEFVRSMSGIPTSQCKVGICEQCGICHV
jgi:radical SAM family uncharacterized protein